MNEGTSDPNDLIMLPVVFLLVLAVAALVFWLIRRFGPRPTTASVPPVPPAPRLELAEAVQVLRGAGIDTDEALGPWLVEARGYATPDEL
jgi:hypothetical protein